ncbi:MAG: GAF domain-containing protein [Planctomycetota bacterium]|nr:GAF domain-containing protein [Planctomycetota bacterium]
MESNSGSHAESETLAQKYEQLERQFREFAEIGIRLSTEFDLDRLLDLILKEARKFTRADAGSLYVAEGERLTFRVNQNDTLEKRPGDGARKAFKSFSFPIDDRSISGSVAKNRRTLNIPNVQTHPLHNKKVDRELDYVTSSMLVVPMMDHRGEVLGVLQLINSRDSQGEVVPFPVESEQMVESLSSQAAVSLENARLYQEIQRCMDSLIKYSAKAIDARDPCTAGHSSRVSRYSVVIATALGSFTDAEIREIRFAGLLHDVGKIGVREQVLNKENKLSDYQLETVRERFNTIRFSREREAERKHLRGEISEEAYEEARGQIEKELEEDLDYVVGKNRPGYMPDEDIVRLDKIGAKRFSDPAGKEKPYLTEFELENLRVRKGNLTAAERRDIEGHVIHSFNILKQIPFPRDLRNVVKFATEHHEKLNGKGYPKGLTEDQIPLQSRILGVADIFDALTASDRPYKPPMSNDKALSIINEGVADGQWDEKVVKCLADLVAQGKVHRVRTEE